jgi:hypothetical protein
MRNARINAPEHLMIATRAETTLLFLNVTVSMTNALFPSPSTIPHLLDKIAQANTKTAAPLASKLITNAIPITPIAKTFAPLLKIHAAAQGTRL